MLDIKRCLEEPLLEGLIDALANRIKNDLKDPRDKYVKPDVACEMLSVKDTTLAALKKEGEIRAYQRVIPGGTFLVEVKSIDEYMARNTR